jgi:hypothetical protein
MRNFLTRTASAIVFAALFLAGLLSYNILAFSFRGKPPSKVSFERIR